MEVRNSQSVLEANLATVRQRIAVACARSGRSPEEITLVAVTKEVEVATIRQLYDLGIRDVGENRPQSLWRKYVHLPHDLRWHLIGHLQTNKVRRTLPLVHSIHSVDRPAVAEVISQEAERVEKRVPICLEVNVSGESTKDGFSPKEVTEHFPQIAELPGITVIGLMTMAPFDEAIEHCRPVFAGLRKLRDELGGKGALPMLSMGMSRDFEVAIEEGATHVRVGSALFEGIAT
ncbi:MAG: YggS family pyridoxal phosphate-dependent enzyme [Planctomycetota bacterium]